MKIGGIILIVLGAILSILGIAVNSTPDLKLLSFLIGKGTNPGTPLIIIGLLILIGGVVLLVFGLKKKNKFINDK